ncbi:hypothetical protein [Amphritea balenae]|uniref:Uncharacterized protein n=1 Tax=Amphritea balenae TaxID=452629 RepID=A0A3P1SYV8_9GAMM|nr:hypothetical protein [Amphritea balenae]RRD01736.1 hypothetical protein EHS89_04085 [Amphritea balenae]GGK54521.1 hypothetical protein GCM10007941_00700 [Amphritea balenae]
MKRGLWVLSSVILVATLIAVLFIDYKDPDSIDLSPDFLTPLTQSSLSAVGEFRNQIRPLESEVGNIRSSISAIGSQRTPTPSLNAFNQQFVSAVQQADSQRQQQLQEIQNRLGQVGTQLVDLNQRATAMDVRIQDSVRLINERVTTVTSSQSKKQDPLQLIVVLVGLVVSFSTMLLAWRKDSREERDEIRRSKDAT